jgi:recombinational DNA repair protein (RecF pathway)
MIEAIGQDVHDHLHDRGGPLAPCRERACSDCEGSIDAGRYHSLGGELLCDQCAPGHAIRIITSTSNSIELQEAIDVLRQIAREFEAGEWRRT